MLDNKLNLVCKVETPQGEVHVHHAIVGYDCFKANYRLISRISARMFEDGAEFLAPLTGAFMFNDVAGHGVDLTRIRPRDIDAMTGIDKIAIEKDLAFMGELKRMTNVICMNNGNCNLPNYNIHSANPVGADNIVSLLDHYRRFFSYSI